MNVAIVVGCSAYEDPDIAPLRYADQDAVRFSNVLKETCGLNDQELTLLSDETADSRLKPTRVSIHGSRRSAWVVVRPGEGSLTCG